MGGRLLRLKISAPARLHFGIIDMRGDLGRIHGSAGVSVQTPRLVLDVQGSSDTNVCGDQSGRVSQLIEMIRAIYNISSSISVKMIQEIPEHIGFGSGTQLALSLGMAFNKIYDLNQSLDQIAVHLKRGRVSGIGTHGFIKGGFIVDGGHRIGNPNSIPPLIYRQDFPENWRFIICIPDIKKGLSGEKEQKAFQQLKPPKADTVAHVSRVVLMQMIPAIIEEDIDLFGSAITKLDTIFGAYWTEIQGGTYSHPRIEECVNHLLDIGAYGAGQTSWGPALYGLVNGENQAKRLLQSMKKFLNDGENTGKAYISNADNRGASITEMVA